MRHSEKVLIEFLKKWNEHARTVRDMLAVEITLCRFLKDLNFVICGLTQ
jgi:hypothetical protein